MMHFTEAEGAVYYPHDRRFRIWIRPSFLLLMIVLVLVPCIFAWLSRVFWGLPYIAPNPAAAVGAASGPHGFPVWIRWCHFFNLFFMFMLIRLGISEIASSVFPVCFAVVRHYSLSRRSS